MRGRSRGGVSEETSRKTITLSNNLSPPFSVNSPGRLLPCFIVSKTLPDSSVFSV